MSDVSSADERHQHNHVLEPIPPLPIGYLAFSLGSAFCPGDNGLGIYDDDHTCYTNERRRDINNRGYMRPSEFIPVRWKTYTYLYEPPSCIHRHEDATATAAAPTLSIKEYHQR